MAWEKICDLDFRGDTTATLGMELENPASLYVDYDSPFNLPYDHIGFIQVSNNEDIADLDLNSYVPAGYITEPDIGMYVKEARNKKLREMGYSEEEVYYGWTETDDGDFDTDLDDVVIKWSIGDADSLMREIIDESLDSSETILTDFDDDAVFEIHMCFEDWVYEELRSIDEFNDVI